MAVKLSGYVTLVESSGSSSRAITTARTSSASPSNQRDSPSTGGPDRVHTGVVLVRLAFAAGVAAGALTGCSDDDGASDTGAYAVQANDDWKMQEAIDLAPDDPFATRQRPPLDWYGEFVRSDHTEMVRLSGHDVRLSDARSQLEALGFVFSNVTVPGHGEGVVGNAPGDESGPELLLLASSGERTFMALSYDVQRDVLLEFMRSVEGAERDEWVDAGGVIR